MYNFYEFFFIDNCNFWFECFEGVELEKRIVLLNFSVKVIVIRILDEI